MYLNFICRASKKLRNGLNPLELSIIFGKERKIITLSRQIKAQDFNSKRQRVRRDEETNLYMDAVRAKFYSIESEMLRRNMPMDINLLLDMYANGFEDREITILTLFDRHNTEAKSKVEHGMISDVITSIVFLIKWDAKQCLILHPCKVLFPCGYFKVIFYNTEVDKCISYK